MAINSIVAQIDAEIARLTQARALLVGLGPTSASALKALPAPEKSKTRNRLSPEARKRIADAQRKRWAAHKVKSKSK
jgi:hypothetical protein